MFADPSSISSPVAPAAPVHDFRSPSPVYTVDIEEDSQDDSSMLYHAYHEDSPVPGPSRQASSRTPSPHFTSLRRSPSPFSIDEPVESVDQSTVEPQDEAIPYSSFYQEVEVDHSSPHLSRSSSLRSTSRNGVSLSRSLSLMSSPRNAPTLSRSPSLRSSAGRTPTAWPHNLDSPTPGTRTSPVSLLRPSSRQPTLPVLDKDESVVQTSLSPRISVVDDIQDVLSQRRPSRDGPQSADWARVPRSPSYSLIPPLTATSEPIGSPSSSQQSCISEVEHHPEGHEPWRSSKVPFGFRNSVAVSVLQKFSFPFGSDRRIGSETRIVEYTSPWQCSVDPTTSTGVDCSQLQSK